jgi:hypothetical protein
MAELATNVPLLHPGRLAIEAFPHGLSELALDLRHRSNPVPIGRALRRTGARSLLDPGIAQRCRALRMASANDLIRLGLGLRRVRCDPSNQRIAPVDGQAYPVVLQPRCRLKLTCGRWKRLFGLDGGGGSLDGLWLSGPHERNDGTAAMLAIRCHARNGQTGSDAKVPVHFSSLLLFFANGSPAWSKRTAPRPEGHQVAAAH